MHTYMDACVHIHTIYKVNLNANTASTHDLPSGLPKKKKCQVKISINLKCQNLDP